MDTFWQDLRFALRLLIKNRSVTVIALLTLALGIGANTAIFTLVNAVLLRGLPYPQPDRLVMVFNSYPKLDIARSTVSPADYVEYQRALKSYSSFAAVTSFRAPQNLTGAGEPLRVRCATASAPFFPALGVEPILGRVFTAEEDQPGQNRVAVLSHALWKSQFNGDPQIIGKEIRLDGANYSVIGVMPAGFQFPSEAELWVPIAFTSQQLAESPEYLNVIARLRDGVSPAQARAELDSLSQEIRSGLSGASTSGWRIVLDPLEERLLGDLRQPLLVLSGAVLFVLLIACANLAHLLLARVGAREKEFAIRLALGAGKSHLARQLLTECVLLALAGGGLGILLAFWGLDAMTGLLPIDLPSFVQVKLDARVLGFTAVLSVLTGILFGLFPAWQAARGRLNETLKEGGRTSGVALGRRPMRSLLIAAEVACALVLLLGAGLLLQSFARLQVKDYGFDPDGVLTLGVNLPREKYPGLEHIWSFHNRVLERVRALPGVESAGMASSLPLQVGAAATFDIEGKEITPRPHAFRADASPGYFEAMRIALLKGRLFDSRDGLGSPPVAIVDDKLAAMYFPNEDPIGRRISYPWETQDGRPVWREIIGVVRGVKHLDALSQETKGQVYLPLGQGRPTFECAIVVRVAGDPTVLASAVRREILSVDPEQPTFNVRAMSVLLSDYVAQPRFNMFLLAIFAAVSLVLAAAGIYGVISHSVGQRTHEIGIRVALGAERRQILRMILGQGLRMVAVGIAVGLAGAAWLAQFLASLLFEVDARDPWTFALATVALLAVALAACWIPARRAMRVDPIVALRYE